MLNDMDVMRLFGVPNTTMRDWKKKDKGDWRYKVAMFLKSQDKERVEAFLKAYELEELSPSKTQS
jgi:hypothetical protein